MASGSSSIELEASLQRMKEDMHARSQHVTKEQGFLSQKERDYLELHRSLGEVNTTWGVGQPLSLTSPRPFIGPFITVAKKLLHRLLRFYINALMEQQRDFNLATAKTLSILTIRIETLNTVIESQQATIRNLRKQEMHEPVHVEKTASPK